MKRVSRARSVPTPSHASGASLEELLAFERLLSDLSARFANVAADQVVAEIEGALKRLLRFLGFDRGAFWEFVNDEKQHFLCSAAVEGVEAPMPGPIPADLELVCQGASCRAHCRHSIRQRHPTGGGCRGGIQSPRRDSLGPRHSAARWRPHRRRDRLRRVPVHAGMAGRVRRASNGHWRGNGPGACTYPLRGSASGERGALAVNLCVIQHRHFDF